MASACIRNDSVYGLARRQSTDLILTLVPLATPLRRSGTRDRRPCVGVCCVDGRDLGLRMFPHRGGHAILRGAMSFCAERRIWLLSKDAVHAVTYRHKVKCFDETVRMVL